MKSTHTVNKEDKHQQEEKDYSVLEINELKKLAKGPLFGSGDPGAQFFLALCKLREPKRDKDSLRIYNEDAYKKSFYWAEKSAKNNHPNGQALLGFLYRYGLGCKASKEHAMHWITEGVKNKSSFAMIQLASILSNEAYEHRKLDSARIDYDRLDPRSELVDINGQTIYDIFYFRTTIASYVRLPSDFIPNNFAKAVSLCEEVIKHPPQKDYPLFSCLDRAYKIISNCYYLGDNTLKKDYSLATEYFLEAAIKKIYIDYQENKSPFKYFIKRSDIPNYALINEDKEKKLIKAYSEKDYGLLGILYYGLETNGKKTIEYLQMGHAVRHPEAIYLLHKATNDKEIATNLLIESAELGYCKAEYYLGVAHEKGEKYINKNLNTAYSFYRRAAKKGESDAKSALERLTKTNPQLQWQNCVEDAAEGDITAQDALGLHANFHPVSIRNHRDDPTVLELKDNDRKKIEEQIINFKSTESLKIISYFQILPKDLPLAILKKYITIAANEFQKSEFSTAIGPFFELLLIVIDEVNKWFISYKEANFAVDIRELTANVMQFIENCENSIYSSYQINETHIKICSNKDLEIKDESINEKIAYSLNFIGKMDYLQKIMIMKIIKAKKACLEKIRNECAANANDPQISHFISESEKFIIDDPLASILPYMQVLSALIREVKFDTLKKHLIDVESYLKNITSLQKDIEHNKATKLEMSQSLKDCFTPVENYTSEVKIRMARIKDIIDKADKHLSPIFNKIDEVDAVPPEFSEYKDKFTEIQSATRELKETIRKINNLIYCNYSLKNSEIGLNPYVIHHYPKEVEMMRQCLIHKKMEDNFLPIHSLMNSLTQQGLNLETACGNFDNSSKQKKTFTDSIASLRSLPVLSAPQRFHQPFVPNIQVQNLSLDQLGKNNNSVKY